jgi:hypothetical protein
VVSNFAGIVGISPPAPRFPAAVAMEMNRRALVRAYTELDANVACLVRNKPILSTILSLLKRDQLH